MVIPRCWFDQDKCKVGLEALRHYHRAYNERTRSFRASPVHDWSSHSADAFRYFAVGLKEQKDWAHPPQRIASSDYNPFTHKGDSQWVS